LPHLDKNHRNELHRKRNVVGTGVGLKKVKGRLTNERAVVVYVSRKFDSRELSDDDLIPIRIAGLPTDVQQINFKALDDPNFYRPAPGGCSVGHFRITAGTLGCWVRYKNEICILSNNHVLADSNAGAIGDQILQPGPYDNGQFPIATLFEFIPIELDSGGGIPIPDCPVADFFQFFLNLAAKLAGSSVRLKQVRIAAAPNYVDSALAKAIGSDVYRYEILEIGRLDTRPQVPNLGLEVKKRGRTTTLTRGSVTATEVSVQVSGYGGDGVATFEDQIIIEDPGGGEFSAGGDSGSLIVSVENRPVGLLFAGGTDNNGNNITVANRVERLLEAFPGIEFL